MAFAGESFLSWKLGRFCGKNRRLKSGECHKKCEKSIFRATTPSFKPFRMRRTHCFFFFLWGQALRIIKKRHSSHFVLIQRANLFSRNAPPHFP